MPPDVDEASPQARIERLRAELERHNHAYYVLDAPTVPDAEYDRLLAELDWVAAKRIGFMFCCDANFGILKRDIDLARRAAAVKAQSGFPQALSVQNTKNATERA